MSDHGLRPWVRVGVLLALSVGGPLLVLGLAEAGLRVLDLYPPPANPITSRRPDLYRADPDVGYRLWSNLDTTYFYPPDRPDPIGLQANSSGFRNAREFDESDERPRILFLGDSFVFGEGVQVEERLTEVIEAREPGWRIDNLGMTGFGLDLMIRALERFAEEADPDVVVLCFYTDDFRRLHPYYSGVGFEFAKFRLDEGALVSVPFKHPRFFGRTRLAQAAIRSYWLGRRNRYDLNEALLDRFLALSFEHVFRPVTLFLPGRDDTPEDKERRGFLRAWAERNNVVHVDLTDTIRAAGVDNLYIPSNPHWNPKGHRVAGELIGDLLAEHVLGSG